MNVTTAAVFFIDAEFEIEVIVDEDLGLLIVNILVMDGEEGTQTDGHDYSAYSGNNTFIKHQACFVNEDE